MEEERDIFRQLKEMFPDQNDEEIVDWILFTDGFGTEDKEERICFLAQMLIESACCNPVQEGAVGFDFQNKQKLDHSCIYQQLKDCLPDADPSFLENKTKELIKTSSYDKVNEFLTGAIENNDYPTMQNFLLKQKNNDTYLTDNFNIEQYLKIIPNPISKFLDSNRTFQYSNEIEQFTKNFLFNTYTFIRKTYIELIYEQNGKNLTKTSERLDRFPRSLRKSRKPIPLTLPNDANVEYLQELAFVKNKRDIKMAIKMKDQFYREAKEDAKKLNLLKTCLCCYEEDLIPEECFLCKKGCTFCKDCVARNTEIIIGKGEIRINCICCDSDFSLWTLKNALNPVLFDQLFKKVQAEEVKQANIAGLFTCLFCDFAMEISENITIFKCINPECMKESCILCGHESHVPQKCSEIEFDEDIKQRTYIEDKMTEALVRTCHVCKKVFIKENGCNKMTCTCGAKQCYICRKNIDSYNHFGEPPKCPLTSDDSIFNLENIRNNAAKAKEDLGVDSVKFDPSKGLY